MIDTHLMLTIAAAIVVANIFNHILFWLLFSRKHQAVSAGSSRNFNGGKSHKTESTPH